MENNNFNNQFPQQPQQPQQPQYQQPQYQQAPQYQQQAQAPQYQQPQPQYQQPQYGAPNYYGAPPAQLKTDRSFIKTLLLSIVTCGIYALIVWCQIPTDLNLIAGRYDGKKTMHYLLAGLLTVPTCGIYAFVWFHGLSARIGNELQRRGIPYSFGASDFWLWYVLGSLLFFAGPIVYTCKLFKAMNLLSEDYNIKG